MAHNLSPIQNHILLKLKNAKTLRYRDMQPKNIANDLYNYHLQFLVDKGHVQKINNQYSLSPESIRHIADQYWLTDNVVSLFKVNVITIVSRKVGKKLEILNQIRKANPSYGKVGVMGGDVLKEEPIEVAASRKLKEETGLEAKFRLLGMERRIMYQSGSLFSDVLFPIAYSESSSGQLQPETEYGHNMWVAIDEAIKNESAPYDSIKNITTVLKAVKENRVDKLLFFFEECVQMDTPVHK